jgi:hypothetical protein
VATVVARKRLKLPRIRVAATRNRVTATRDRVTATRARRKIGKRSNRPRLDVNMVFTIPVEFHALAEDVVELTLSVGRAVFEKPENPGVHMKPLLIWGHLDGMPIGHMLVDGGASINILPLSLFKTLGHVEGGLKRTNLSFSGFVGDPTEAKGIICKELTAGSKTMHMAFFVVDVKGCYNMLLGRDWIYANECVTSTLHQCVI